MSQALINVLVGGAVTGIFSLVAYFLHRLITKNDKFQEETGRNFRRLEKELTDKIDHNRIATNNLKFYFQQELARAGLTEETKAEISALTSSLQKIEKELHILRPFVEQSGENYGKIIELEGKLKSQDKKLLGLYMILKKVQSKPSGQ